MSEDNIIPFRDSAKVDANIIAGLKKFVEEVESGRVKSFCFAGLGEKDVPWSALVADTSKLCPLLGALEVAKMRLLRYLEERQPSVVAP